MKNIFVIALLFVVVATTTGCSSYSSKTMSDPVAVMPNDCANEQALTKYLEQQIEGTSDEATQRRIKHRLWDFRYNCNFVAGK